MQAPGGVSGEAIPAATVILVRDRVAGGCEVLMVERAGGMAFAAGAMVFPGGRIDQADREFAKRAGTEAALVAAVREAIEETAIPVGLAPSPDAALASVLQGELLADRPLAQVLRQHALELDPGALVPFARWVPQFHAVRRFDTLFYVAPAPSGDWQPRVVEGECASAEWVRAADVLEREKNGEARLIFPTRRTLERLALQSSFEAIRGDAEAHPIEPITPWVEERGGDKFIAIPAHLGFPVTEERLDGLWRG
jgi:8-oxo-dGTP pyrophosphatase MutT (NUDIX family)